MSYYLNYIDSLCSALKALSEVQVNEAFEMIWSAWMHDRDVFVIGNGGSASTASHMACDMGKGTVTEGKRRLRIQSLTDNMAHFSALANDLGYEHVFTEPLRNLMRPGDLLIGISASGNSPNVVNAFEWAAAQGARTMAMVGFSGGKMKQIADVSVHIELSEYGPIEDAHMILNHLWTQELKRRIASR
jgi:D-sedoheptulose 7-phosphate isomerase